MPSLLLRLRPPCPGCCCPRLLGGRRPRRRRPRPPEAGGRSGPTFIVLFSGSLTSSFGRRTAHDLLLPLVQLPPALYILGARGKIHREGTPFVNDLFRFGAWS